MLNENIFSKSICLNSQTHMNEICGYLSKYLGIEHFTYIKSFDDGTHICLTTHAEWIKYFYLKLYSHGVHHKTNDAYNTGVVLWSTIKDQTSFTAFKQYCKLSHGISLIEKHKNFCEFFTFATDENNSQIINFYINNLDTLWRHAAYFREKGKTLITEANRDRAILPKCKVAKPKDTLIINKEEVNTVLAEIPINRYDLSVDGVKINLTARQEDCLFFLIRGKTLKETAKELKLSPRTIESHVEAIKNKLGCKYLSEVIEKIMDSNFLHKKSGV